MSRCAADIRAELDALNARRVEKDALITTLRGELNDMNAQANALEKEFQAADAAEAQAKLSGG